MRLFQALVFTPLVFILFVDACHSQSKINLFQRKADSLTKVGRYAEANNYLKKAESYYNKTANWKSYLKVHRKIILNLIYSGEFDSLERSVYSIQSKIDTLNYDTIEFKSFISFAFSYLYRLKGDVAKALKYDLNALKIYKKEKRNSRIPKLLMNIGVSYHSLGAYDIAENYLRKAINSLEQQSNNTTLSSIYNNLALVYRSKNKLNLALEFANKSIAIRKKHLGEDHSYTDYSHQLLGLIHQESKNFDKALEYFNINLRYREKKHSANHLLVATTLLNIGNVYSEQKKFDLALKNYQKSLKIWKTYKQREPITNLYYLIGELHSKQREFQKSLYFYQKALVYNSSSFKDSVNFSSNPNSNQYLHSRFFLQTLKSKASVLQSIGDAKSLQVALETYQLCDEVIQKLRQQYVNYRDKLTLANLSAEIYEQAVMACHQMTQKQPAKENQYTALAFQFSERNKASILREALQEANAKFDLPANLVEQERDLKINLAYYEKQLANAQNRKDSTKVVRFQNKLFDLNREREQMTQMLEKRYPRYYQLKYNTQLADIAAIKKRLPDKALLVEYFTTDQKSFAFVVSKTQCKMLALPGGKNVRKIIRKYGRNLKTRKPVAYFAPSAYAAYEQLIQPLEAYLKNKDQLIVVADNALLGIPFEALLSEKVPETTRSFADLPFLIKQFSFSYHYSANLMVQPMLRNAQSQQNSFLGFAPVFTKSATGNTRDDNVGTKPKSLPYTEKEIDKIIEVFKQQGQTNIQAVLHQKATEEAFKKVGQNFRFVHLATHSITNSKRPELAYIQFEPTPQNQENFNEGRLYANEIYALHLNADLVVLSSCESGSGKIERGEGMMGLNRGFLYAGARNVIYSLWKVNDRPTSAFMIRFYQNLLQQKYAFHKALQQTKLQYLKKNPQNRPHDWAGFLIIGQL
ncbi:MAG TPA: hypothetical protein DCS93_01170 [Microscillaceae bacterium]|nr:hypothetical protein [Microscillaceae bacterium]